MNFHLQYISHNRAYDAKTPCFSSILPWDEKAESKLHTLYQFCISNKCNSPPIKRRPNFSNTILIKEIGIFLKIKFITFRTLIPSIPCPLSQFEQICKFYYKDHKEKFYFDSKVIRNNQLPIEYLNGNELEIIRSTSAQNDLIKNYDWNQWKEKDPHAAYTYKAILYPHFFLALKFISEALGDQPLKIIDVGGGNGELALMVRHHPKVKKIYVLDNNIRSLALLNTVKNCYQDHKIQIHLKNITELEIFTEVSSKQVDIIFLCGVVAHQVLTKSDSITLLMRCKEKIKDNGYICIASHTITYFKREDYEIMGFSVINSVALYTSGEKYEVKIEPFYIIQKKS